MSLPHTITGWVLPIALAGSATGLSAYADAATEPTILIETRALTKTDGVFGPRLGPDIVFDGFDTPVLNNAGEIAFEAWVRRGVFSVPNHQGYWSSSAPGDIDLIARDGSMLPGLSEGTFVMASPTDTRLLVNDAGQFVFVGGLTAPGEAGYLTIFIKDGPDVQVIARQTDQVPGMAPGVVHEELELPLLDNNGGVLFKSELVGPGIDSLNDSTIWQYNGGALSLVARGGDNPKPVGPGYYAVAEPAYNQAGQVAFLWFAPDPIPGGFDRPEVGLSSNAGGAFEVVVKERDPVPGLPAGSVFGPPSAPILNNAGQLAFTANISAPAVPQIDGRKGLWAQGPDGIRNVAQVGTTLPGLSPDARLGTIAGTPAFNDNGHVAFYAYLEGGVTSFNDEAIYSEAGGNGLQLIARSGDAAPGVPDGATFVAFDDPMLSDTGQTAFIGYLAGLDVQGSPFVRGLWMADADGTLHTIVYTGQEIDVNPDPLGEDLRTVLAVNINDASTSQGTAQDEIPNGGFNESGQFAFHLKFTNNTEGLFVATIPEPGSLGLLGLSAALLIRRPVS